MGRLLKLIVVVLAGVGIYALWQPDIRHDIKALSPAKEVLEGPTRIYKWRDDAGDWQLTDEPPPAGVPYEVREYPRDLNTLPVPPQLKKD